MATLTSIVYQPQDQQYGDRLDHFIRVRTDQAKLIAGHGIEGDQKAGRNPTRQVNLITTDWLDTRRNEGYEIRPGKFGEQLIVDGLLFDDLLPGTRLQLGEAAVIEITKTRNGCDRMEMAQEKPVPEPIKIAGIGHLAKVLESGTIQVGDPVKLLVQTA